jgi:putative hydrolase of the HAD superfamily
VSFPVRAITLDLDDTIWPIEPVIVRAEAALGAWLQQHAPRTAAHWPLEARRALRDEVAATHPHLAHDFTRQRMISLERMFAAAGDDPALAAPAFDAFFAARCEVEHYADSLAALDRLAARLPLAALTNGNADLERIGLMHVLRFQLGARMALSPLVLILALMVFGWLWGIVGLLLAVPLLVCFKIVLTKIEGMEGWARLLE